MDNIHRPSTAQRSWREYENKRPRSTNGLYVSLSPQGVILLNRLTYDSFGRPASVKLLYDEKRETIGIESVEGWMPTAFTVATRGECDNHIIVAPGFLGDNHLKIDYTIKFLDPHFEDGVLILDLKLTASATRPGRRKHNAHGAQ